MAKALAQRPAAWASSGDTVPNAAKPQPRRASAPTTNTPRFAVT